MPSIEVVAIVKPKAGKAERLQQLVTAVLAHVEANEPGCTKYQIQKELGSEEPRYFVFEAYQDEAAFEAHSASVPFQAFAKAIGEEDLLAAPLEVLKTGIVGGFNSRA